MKADQERVSKLLTDTITLLCKNGLIYNQDIKVQGLLGITLDNKDVFLVQINEVVGSVAAPTVGSNESARKKSTSVSSSSVVDLTRIADTPMPQTHVPPMPMMQHGMMQSQGPRKQRQVHQHQQMVMPPLQMPSRSMYNPRGMRMNTAAMQQGYGSQFAASYMARLQQQVARAPHVPIRMMPHTVRQRGNGRRQSMQVPVLSHNVEDEEDVVIIGTGHEDPSPHWNSPSRRHASSSNSPSTSSSDRWSKPTVQVGMKSQRSGMNSSESEHSFRSNKHTTITKNAMDDRSANDIEVTGTLELTAEDVSQSVEQLFLRATSGLVTDADETRSSRSGGSCHHDAGDDDARISDDELVAETSTQFSSVSTASDGLELRRHTAIIADHGNRSMSAGKNRLAVEADGTNNGDRACKPLVYTDNAELECDMGTLLQPSAVEIETPGFDVLTEDAVLKGTGTDDQVCRYAGCSASFDHTDQLTLHYRMFHADPLSLVPASSDDTQPPKDSAGVPSGDGASDDGGFPCTLPTCGAQLASQDALQAHQHSVHGTTQSLASPTSSNRKRRAESSASDLSKVTSKKAGSSSEYGSFLCPVVGCLGQYDSRDDVYEHVKSVHQSLSTSTDGDSTEQFQAKCKEEV